MLFALILACDPVSDTAEPTLGGALGEGRQNPFPSAELVGSDGYLALEAGDLPVHEGGTEWDFARFNRRTGFSPVQPAVVRMPTPIDATSILGEASIGTDGAVRLVDLDTGERLLCFSELDAAPETIDGNRALIVRPMQTLASGHRIAVVVTSAVTTGGAPFSFPEPEGHYADLQAKLAALGESDVVLAWDFPVERDTAALDGALAVNNAVPAVHTFSRTWEVGSDDPPVAGQWRAAEGTYTTTELLVDETHFQYDSAWLPVAQGSREAYLFVTIPESVKDKPAGTVPVLIFGHGIMAEPEDYLAEEGDPNGVLTIAEELGAIVIATKWTGLTEDDRLHAILTAGDFANFHEIPEMLAQGVSDTVALLSLVQDGDLLSDPVFAGLADPSTVYWYGISLGGIQGAVTLANQSVIDRGVLHVGGAAWATMLERSAQWPPFELVVSRNFPDPFERQVLYAASQVLWDPVDPALHAEALGQRTLLWQEAIGDEQVPNLTTELLMRSAGLPLLTPSITTPPSLPTVAMPTTGAGLVQFDPEVGLPEAANRPGASSGAHSIPRTWAGAQAQTVHFLTTGEAAHFCGEAPCSASNSGSW